MARPRGRTGARRWPAGLALKGVLAAAATVLMAVAAHADGAEPRDGPPEWTLRAERSADRAGTAPFHELSGCPAEVDQQADLLSLEQGGRSAATIGVTGARAWSLAPGVSLSQVELEVVAVLRYALLPALELGLEGVGHADVVGGSLDGATLSAGPVVTYSRPRWWISVSYQPELAASPGAGGPGFGLEDVGDGLARVVVGIQL